VHFGVVYKKLVSTSSLVGYSDSDLAGDIDDRKSTSGSVFLLGSSLVIWMSHKQWLSGSFESFGDSEGVSSSCSRLKLRVVSSAKNPHNPSVPSIN
jgi:hypothetical protein